MNDAEDQLPKRPEIIFEPFLENDDDIDQDEYFNESQTALVYAHLSIRFSDYEEATRLAETILAHLRVHDTEKPLCIPGRIWCFHDDESLPPSVFAQDKLPEWLQLIFDAYRKTEAAKLLNELDRLQGIIEAAASSDPDSYFTDEEIEHRADVKMAQADAFGSREELREQLDMVLGALRHYASGPDPLRAKYALTFLGEIETEEG